MNEAVATTMFGGTVRTSIITVLTVTMLLLPFSLVWCCEGSSDSDQRDIAEAHVQSHESP